MSGAVQPHQEASFSFAKGQPFPLSGGSELGPVTLQYAIYGELNRQRSNGILVCHALSGSSRVADWWPEVIGPGKALDTRRYCVIGINVLGSCYGSTGPLSIDPRSGERYAANFPLVSINDMVRAQAVLINELRIPSLHAVIGGSIGGMQAIEWAVTFPDRVKKCIAIGAAPLSALGLALNHIQREAIRNDPAWQGGNYEPGAQPAAGLALARKIAMCTYKSERLFAERFHRRPNRSGDDPKQGLLGRFDVAGYLDFQGDTFTDRFDANSYLVLSKAMDLFDLSGVRGHGREKLSNIQGRMLLIGISSDWLFPPENVRSLSNRMLDAGVECRYEEFESDHGHDAFLADADRLGPILEAELTFDPANSFVESTNGLLCATQGK